jgi:hypothetical protein
MKSILGYICDLTLPCLFVIELSSDKKHWTFDQDVKYRSPSEYSINPEVFTATKHLMHYQYAEA